MPAVTGATRIVGIVADPIAHVRTPEVMNARFAEQGVDAVVVPMHVSAEGLQSAWRGLRELRNLSGLIVTVPHKTQVPALCDELGENARLVGAANAIYRRADGSMLGEMFDGLGFVEGLRREGRDPAGQDVLLIGAGGAASAIAFALAQAGVARLAVANRSRDKAQRLVEQLTLAFPQVQAEVGEASGAGHDLVINGTSLGLGPQDPLPLDPETLDPTTTVAEVIMRPARTRLLEAAAARGCPTHEGLHMLQAQLDLLARFVLEGLS